jgi:hypothetical protein
MVGRVPQGLNVENMQDLNVQTLQCLGNAHGHSLSQWEERSEFVSENNEALGV